MVAPLLLQTCWQALQAAWERSGAVSADALRRYVGSGALAATEGEGDGASTGAAGAEAASAAGMLGAYLQLHGVPAARELQQTAQQVQGMLQGAGLPDAGAATAAAAAMLAATHRGMALPAAQSLAAALLH